MFRFNIEELIRGTDGDILNAICSWSILRSFPKYDAVKDEDLVYQMLYYIKHDILKVKSHDAFFVETLKIVSGYGLVGENILSSWILISETDTRWTLLEYIYTEGCDRPVIKDEIVPDLDIVYDNIVYKVIEKFGDRVRRYIKV